VAGTFGPAGRHRGRRVLAAGGAVLVFAGLAGAPESARAAEFLESLAFRAEASYTTDSNVNRASAGETLQDRILGVRASASIAEPLSMRTRALVQGFAGTERFQTYTGLSRNFIGAQGDLQYRSSGEFGAGTYGVFARTAAEYYESNLRDGYRHAFGVTVLKPLTDRIQTFGALAWNIADGGSTVFDTKYVSLRGSADWSLGRRDVVYLGAEYRRGDIVSTGMATLARVNIADAIIQDDAFGDTTRFAYRFQATTWLATLGYNRALGEKHSLDVSWRRAQSTPLHSPGYGSASEVRYVVSQFSLAYLARF
jgi:hypothetical protein